MTASRVISLINLCGGIFIFATAWYVNHNLLKMAKRMFHIYYETKRLHKEITQLHLAVRLTAIQFDIADTIQKYSDG